MELTYLESDETGRFDRTLSWESSERVAAVSAGRSSGRRRQFLRSDPDRHRRTLAWLDDCTRRGLRVYAQGVTLKLSESEFTSGLEPVRQQPGLEGSDRGSPSERKAKMQTRRCG